MILFSRLIEKIQKDDLLGLAAALSFYMALSLAPLLILLITFVSSLGPVYQEELLRQTEVLVGAEAAGAIHMILQSSQERPNLQSWAGWLAIITMLFSAGVIFGNLRDSLNRIFELPHIEESENNSWLSNIWSFLSLRIFNMGMVLTFVFVTMVSLVLSSALTLLLDEEKQLLGQVANFIGSIVVFTLLFAALFRFMPSRKIAKTVALSTGFLTAILFSIGKTLIGFYLGASAIGSAYGAAGSMVILLIWVYYSSAIIFLCAEIAHVFDLKWRGSTL